MVLPNSQSPVKQRGLYSEFLGPKPTVSASPSGGLIKPLSASGSRTPLSPGSSYQQPNVVPNNSISSSSGAKKLNVTSFRGTALRQAASATLQSQESTNAKSQQQQQQQSANVNQQSTLSPKSPGGTRLYPKVSVPYQTSIHSVPRRICIERCVRLYAAVDLNRLLAERAHIDYSKYHLLIDQCAVPLSSSTTSSQQQQATAAPAYLSLALFDDESYETRSVDS
jgi:hypothetical protein